MNIKGDTGIYSITSPSGKQYIGSAASFRRRWTKHLHDLRVGKHHNKPLLSAYRKYGESALKFEKIALCAVSDLLRLEQCFIDLLGPAYNVSPIAGSTLGVKLGPLSDEHKRKIAQGHKGRKLSDDQRAYLAERLRGRKMPEAHKEWLSQKLSGIGNHFFGKKHSPETIVKMSGDAHHSSRAVICLETGLRFGSIRKACTWLRENGFPRASPSPICACCQGGPRHKKPYGFTWRYHDHGEVERHRCDVGMLA